MKACSDAAQASGGGSHGWLGRELSDEQSWRLQLSPQARELLIELGRARLAGDEAAVRVHELAPLRELVCETRRRLTGFPGFVVLCGVPVDAMSDELCVATLFALGRCLGRPVSQDSTGTFVARVEDKKADISDATQRGHRSSAALPFHVDRTDVIGLLCVQPAENGGDSQLASAHAVHRLLSERQPTLLQELYRELPHDRRGEQHPGEASWIPLSVFSELDGRIVSRYVRRFIDGSQRFEDAPRLTDRQQEALDAVDAILAEPGVALEMRLARGELQLIDNYSVWHARSAFDSSGGAASRLLLRLWLATPDSPRLPASFKALYGAVAAGCLRGGVWPEHAVPADLGAPVQTLLNELATAG
jgi:hypothetical protein